MTAAGKRDVKLERAAIAREPFVKIITLYPIFQWKIELFINLRYF
jgi:hypothetical protein